MAIALDAQLGSIVTNAAGTSLALTTANAAASGTMIFVMVGRWSSSFPASTVSLAGGSLTWTQVSTVTNGNERTSLFYSYAAGGLASSTVITATFSGSSNDRGMSAVSFTGIDSGVTPGDGATSATGTGTIWNAGGITTTNADDLIIGAAYMDGAASSSTPGAGYTEVPATAGDFNDATATETWTMLYQIASSTGTYTAGGTWAASPGNGWAGVSAAFKAATGGGAATSLLTPSFRSSNLYSR